MIHRFLRPLPLVVAVLAAVGALPRAAATTVSSPDGTIEVTVDLDAGGRPTYEVRHRGRTILAPSALGLALDGVPDLDGPFAVGGETTVEVDRTWTPLWGEASRVRDHHRELTLDLAETESPGRTLTVIFRVFDDGVGFRYVIRNAPGAETAAVTVADELTEFRVAPPGRAWWIPQDFDSYEHLYRETPVEEVPAANTPVTFELRPEGDRVFLAIHEADLTDYPEMTLEPVVGPGPGAAADGPGGPTGPEGAVAAEFRAALVPLPGTGGHKAIVTPPFATPWRVLTLTDRAGGLVESSIVPSLNDPCAICDGDTDWIRPSKYVGIWWELHKGKTTWAPGPDLGATTENAERYIDFASAHGIPLLLVEGWNVGWDGGWDGQDFTRAQDRFDLEEVVRYGRERGVGLIAHLETAAGVTAFEAQMEEAFALYESLGIHAIKTGYVGEIEGHHHHDQWMVRHYQRALETAARYRLMVDAHEPIKPTGIRRTWPNFMTREGLRGTEYEAWSEGNPPAHTLILPFTRYLGGPGDYTPGIFETLWRPDGRPGASPRRVHTTRARQLALYVMLFSGLQMVTDLPEHYEGRPELAFLEEVPVSWDETRVPDAGIGRHMAIARRKGDDWWLGAGTDATPRSIPVPLGFLGGGECVATVYADAADADYDRNPDAVSVDSVRVSAADTLVVSMIAGGGQAVRFRPAGDADSSVPRYRSPSLSVTRLDTPAEALAGDVVPVLLEVRNEGNVVGGGDLALAIGDETLTRRVRLAGGETRTVRWEPRLPGAGAEPTPASLRGSAGGVAATIALREPGPGREAPAIRPPVPDPKAGTVALSWEAVPGAAGYRIWRRATAGAFGPEPFARTGAADTAFTDSGVPFEGGFLEYLVRAVGGDGLLSAASGIVRVDTTPRKVRVTFRVRVPESTPAGDVVYLVGDAEELGTWDPGRLPMTKVGDDLWEREVELRDDVPVQYKYTRGSWDLVEWWGSITGTTNRRVTVRWSAGGEQLVDDTRTDWDDASVPDDRKAVRRWRDGS